MNDKAVGQTHLASAPSFEHWGESCHLSAQHSRRGRNQPASGEKRMKRRHRDGDKMSKFKRTGGV